MFREYFLLGSGARRAGPRSPLEAARDWTTRSPLHEQQTYRKGVQAKGEDHGMPWATGEGSWRWGGPVIGRAGAYEHQEGPGSGGGSRG